MKHNNTWLVTLGLIIILVLIAIFVIQKERLEPQLTQEVQSLPESLPRSNNPAPSQITLDASTIKNMGGIEEALGMSMDSFQFKEINWTNISQVNLGSSTMYYGELQRVSGNGKVSHQVDPLFLVDGILYTAYGYGGNQYPYKETDWFPRYKEMEINQYVPIERYGTNSDREDWETYKLQTGIEKIAVKLDTTGGLLSITVTMKDGQVKTVNEPLPRVKTLNLASRPQYNGLDDYQTMMDKNRRLPGNASGRATYVMDTGYSVVHPDMLNGKKVVVLEQGKHSYSFNIEDRQDVADVATINCQENDYQQLGPKTGDPTPISIESRQKLVDWGFAKESYTDVFSFTGPGYRCDLRATQAFTLDMFKIVF